MSHSTTQWLDSFAMRLEPYAVLLAAAAVGLIAMWIAIRTARRQSQTHPPEVTSERTDVSKLPNLSVTDDDDAKLYTGISPLARAQPDRVPVIQNPRTRQRHTLREVTGELVPVPRAASLDDLPDVLDVLATSVFSRPTSSFDCDAETWESATPQTLSGRPPTFDGPTTERGPALLAHDTDVYPAGFDPRAESVSY